jgi:D-serine deaminase-like pyridoxal phosphate-dependent protein
MGLSPVGMNKWDLDTPALLVDLDKMERNIGKMATICQKSGISWRPHTKGNKTPAIAHKLLDAGAIGITCAKLGEAEVMAAAGIKDILVANQVVGKLKMDRLVNLQRHSNVMVCVDNPVHVQMISKAAEEVGVSVRVLVEVDIGMNRCGVSPGKPALELAQQAEAAPGVVFAGIMGYEGHAMDLPVETKEKACAKAISYLADVKALIEESGLKCDIVSAGGTGSLEYTPQCPGLTEIQAGGGIFMDTFYPSAMNVKGLEQALTILTTIVSHPAPDRAYMDAGRKTTFGAFSLPEVKDLQGLKVTALSAEHGYLEIGEDRNPVKIGDKIELISGYSDMTVFLHNHLFGIRNDRVEAVWEILGRGKLQ